nr:glycoside hydrolase family 18 protein [Pseudomonadota bacterium]
MLKKLFVSALFLSMPVMAAAEPIVMGYWENWATYNDYPMPDNANGSINEALRDQFNSINTLAYAFIVTAEDGSVQFSDVWSDLDPNNKLDKEFCQASPASCPGFPANAGHGNFGAFTKANVKHHVISIGGADNDSAWETAFTHQEKFLSTLKLMVETYNIDWIDIDYEPVAGMSKTQTKNLIELTHKMKQAMPDVKYSYAIIADTENVSKLGRANWQKLAKDLDYISIMGYDMHGSFDQSNPYTALHSALIADENEYSTHATIQALNNAGVPNAKIILGMPMYGRAVGGVASSGIGQKFTKSVRGDLDNRKCSTQLHSNNLCSGSIQYRSLVDRSYTATPITVAGQLAGVYTYDADKKIFVSYDNPESATAKAHYAITNELAGVMY